MRSHDLQIFQFFTIFLLTEKLAIISSFSIEKSYFSLCFVSLCISSMIPKAFWVAFITSSSFSCIFPKQSLIPKYSFARTRIISSALFCLFPKCEGRLTSKLKLLFTFVNYYALSHTRRKPFIKNSLLLISILIGTINRSRS